MVLILILGIFIAVVFGKSGANAVQGCVTLIFGIMLLILESAIV